MEAFEVFAWVIVIFFVFPVIGLMCVLFLALAYEVMKFFEKSYENAYKFPLSVKEILQHYVF